VEELARAARALRATTFRGPSIAVILMDGWPSSVTENRPEGDLPMRTIRFAVFVAALLAAASLHATTYYVAPALSGGSNTNPGTLSQPFLTIQYAVGAMHPGDTVYVRAGTYNEYVTIWGFNPTPPVNSPVTYVVNYPNEAPVIDGTGLTGKNAMVAIGGGTAYVHFDGFEVRSSATAGIMVYDGNNIAIKYNTVHDCQNWGIVAESSGNTFDTTHDITIDGNTVRRCVLQNSSGTASSWLQALSAIRATAVNITNNYVYENFGEGIDYILSASGTIAGNHVWDNFSGNIYLDNAQNTTVNANFVIAGRAANPSQYYRSGQPAVGIATANETYTTQRPLTGLTITNNIVVRTHTGFQYGNYGYGHGLHYTTVANNTFYQTTQSMLYIEDGANGTHVHDTTTIENNIFDQRTDQYSAQAPSVGITYQYNDWYGGLSGHTMPGAGDITSDPLLANPSGTSDVDFKLTASSPCINTATSSSAPSADYWGIARPRGTGYDIGAHEY
jgi:hypothetical protein